jgi:hypothetical protein
MLLDLLFFQQLAFEDLVDEFFHGVSHVADTGGVGYAGRLICSPQYTLIGQDQGCLAVSTR